MIGRRGAAAAGGALVLLLVTSLFEADWPWRTDSGRAILGGLGAALLYAVGVVFLRRALSFHMWGLPRMGAKALAVARVVVEEGLRKRVAVFAAAVTITVIALLSMVLEASGPLIYEIKNFLTYGLAVAVASASLLTLFLACGSVAGDIDDRQVYTVLVKPIRRSDYLFGKWLGVVLLDALLLGVAGVELYGFAGLMVERSDDVEAKALVAAEVLNSRRSVRPRPEVPFAVRVERELPAVREEDPQRFAEIGETAVRRRLRTDLELLWKTIPAGESRLYVFGGLGGRQGYRGGGMLRLRPRMHPPPPADQLRLRVELDGGDASTFYCGVDQANMLPLGDALLEDGELRVRLLHPEPDEDGRTPAVNLAGPDGIEVLHPVGSFAGNLARGLLVYWLKMAFLAALGVFGASFLSFPVACLMVLLITGAASTSAFLIDMAGPGAAPGFYSPTAAEKHDHAAEHRVERFFDRLEWAGLWIARRLSKYGELAPAKRIVEGRRVGGDVIFDALAWIGAIWTGSVGLLTLLIFGRRELARVQL